MQSRFEVEREDHRAEAVPMEVAWQSPVETRCSSEVSASRRRIIRSSRLNL